MILEAKENSLFIDNCMRQLTTKYFFIDISSVASKLGSTIIDIQKIYYVNKALKLLTVLKSFESNGVRGRISQ